MTFIIKPLVTEKMNQITEKSSKAKTLTVSKKRAEAKNATEQKVSYSVYKKKNGKVEKVADKEKTIYTYEKPAQAKYGFIVKPEANKLQIAQEVEKLFGVKVLAVNTVRYAGKRSSRYTKAGLVKGQKNAYKKAYVTLKEGDVIDLYSNIE